MKKLYVLFIAISLIFSLSFISAGGVLGGALERPRLNPDLKQGIIDKGIIISPSADIYPALQIRDWFGLGSPEENLILTDISPTCSNDCYSIMDINTYQDSALIDSVKFYTLNLDQDGNEIDRIEQPIRSYQFYIANGTHDEEVNDYEYQCFNNGIIIDGHEQQSCSNVQIGSHTETITDWINYNEGDIYPAGDYQIKLTGDKRPDRTVDWIISSQGQEISDWSIWGNISTHTTDKTNVAIDSHGVGGNDPEGWKIIANTNTILSNVTVGPNTVVSMARLWNSAYSVNLANGTMVGKNASFNYPLVAGTSYIITADNLTTGFDHDYKSGLTTGFPISGTFINYTDGYRVSVGSTQTNVGVITMLTFLINNNGSQVTLNSPINNYNSSSQTIPFNISANVVSANLTNISLLHNASGVFTINKTQYYNVFDASGRGNTGTPLNGVIINSTFAKFGNGGANFDNNSNNYINVSAILAIDIYSNFTICGWYNLTSNKTTDIFSNAINTSDRFTLEYYATSSIAIGAVYNGSNYIHGYKYLNPSLSSYNFVCYVNNVTGSLYLNGVLGISTSTGPSSGGQNGFKIGTRQDASSSYSMNGSIDEVRIYNRSLSPSEISDLYTTNGQSVSTSGLVAYYPFDNIANNGVPTPTGELDTSVNFGSDGSYLWSGRACDTDGVCGQADNRTVNIDSVAPTVSILYPTGTINGLTNGQSLGLNYSISDLHLQACGYQYNGINYSIGNCLANTTFTYVSGVNSVIVWANDSAGNVGSSTNSWSGATINNVTYNLNALSGSYQTFVLNLFDSNYPAISYLNYNGVNYLSSINTLSTNNYLISNSISIPNSIISRNYTFFWNITDSNSSKFITNSYNQSATTLILDNCSTNTNLIFNFTLKDEETQIILNATNISVNLQFKVYDPITNLIISSYNSSSNKNNVKVCVQNNITGFNYAIKGLTEYSADNYVHKFYYLQNYSINPSLMPYNINLYDLLSSNSQEFLINYKDSTFLPASNVLVYVTRYYVSENQFKTVEVAKTDSNGNALVHLQLGDVIYTFIFVDSNGNILSVLSNYIPFCENLASGQCTINTNAFSSTEAITDFNSICGITYNEQMNQTNRTMTLTFQSVSGLSTVTYNVTKYDALGNETICTNSLTSSSGMFVCNIPSSFGDTSFLSQVYANNCLVSDSVNGIPVQQNQAYLGDAILFAILIIITIAMIFITSPVGIIIGTIVGVAVSGALGLLVTGSLISKVGIATTFIFLVISGILLAIKVNKAEGR